MKNFMNYDLNIDKISIACFVPAGTGVSIHKNRPYHGLALNTEGNKEYIFASGERITVCSGDIIYLPKYSTYEVKEKKCGDCYAINFDLTEDITFSPFLLHAKNYSETQKLFRIANAVWESKKKGYILKCKASLYDIIYSMHVSYSVQYLSKNKLEIIKRAVDYIHENYCDCNISISYLAKMFGSSETYFRRVFKSKFNVTPLKYITAMRIKYATELKIQKDKLDRPGRKNFWETGNVCRGF